MSEEFLNCVGPGWRPLIKPLIAFCKQENMEVVQVKEKFGTLRFYVAGHSERLETMVDAAESLSEITCEECGDFGYAHGPNWIRTLCAAHHATRARG